MSIGIVGSGAFGTALGVSIALAGGQVVLWGRNDATITQMRASRSNPRLPGVALPASLSLTSDVAEVLSQQTVLLAIPAQTLPAFLSEHATTLAGKELVACCKGIDLAHLTGPSFAADIARGLPTALTLACADDERSAALQAQISHPRLRLYRTTDVIGAELGGALKNVMAIASGVAIGAGLGESARAALITRGFPEMQRLALSLGGQAETLAGLSGFGDLVLTCTSAQSRNYSYGVALGSGAAFDPAITVEGAATARAVRRLAGERGIDMPITTVVANLTEGKTTVATALDALLSRPLKEE